MFFSSHLQIEGGEAGTSSQPIATTSNAPPDQQKIDKLKAHVAEVSNIMTENIQKIMDRGERLDSLNARSEGLTANSEIFRSSSRRVARKMWWKNARLNIFIGLVVSVIVALILWNALK